MLRKMAWLVVFMLSASPGLAQLIEYWIPDDGCTLVRTLDDGYTYGHRGQAPTSLVRERRLWSPPITRIQQFVWVSGNSLGLSVADYPDEPGAETFYYDPPLIVLDLPLTTDKVWSSTSSRTSNGPTLPRTHVLTCTVIGPTTVETVLGATEVIEVQEVEVISNMYVHNRTLYLNRQYGDVSGLVAAEDCAPMPVAPLSWGAIKSTYR